MTVAVGFNPRSLNRQTDVVAERRLNRGHVIDNPFHLSQPHHTFNRRSATNHSRGIRIRRLKPTATIGCHSATKTARSGSTWRRTR